MSADMHASAPLFDKRAVADSFSRAAECYDSAAALQRLVASLLLEWMPTELADAPLLDLGCGTGFVLDQLHRQHPSRDAIGLDIAEGMLRHCASRFASQPQLRWLCADAEHLPLADASVALATSNFALQWCGNLGRAFAEVNRVLVPGGRFLLSLPAENTLRELRDSWHDADPAHTHVSQFVDEAQLRHAARQGGLGIRRIALLERRLHYPTVAALAEELKTLGAHNASVGRSKTLTPKGVYRRMLAAYEQRRLGNGKLPATWRMLLVEMARKDDRASQT